MTPVEQQLSDNDYIETPILWSFSPFFNQDTYWSKLIPYPGGYTDYIEIGIVLSSDQSHMEVYMCDCVVGCCGINMGTYPFSLDKIDELLNIEKKTIDELKTP